MEELEAAIIETFVAHKLGQVPQKLLYRPLPVSQCV